MADRTLKAGDTWPPLKGTAGDSVIGTYALDDADSLKLIVKHSSGTPLLEVTPVSIDPETNEGFNWQYDWEDGDTDVVGVYSVELEITWNNASTPPEVQTVPNSGFLELVIEDDLGGDR